MMGFFKSLDQSFTSDESILQKIIKIIISKFGLTKI